MKEEKTIYQILEEEWYDNDTIKSIIEWLEDESEYDTEQVYKILFKKENCYA